MRKLAGSGVVAMVLHSDDSCYRIKGITPTFTCWQREDAVRDTGLVDTVYITEDDDPAYRFAQILQDYPSHQPLFVRGDDNLEPPGRWYLDEYGIDQLYLPYTKGISSTMLRSQE